ncbi:uncharacterized protein LOC129899620 [Solanum dulcamara]|uniref:uncharacterized protein LOC129899620 n=1 Tax=Solanum dulcamara TaxID=45834 RepID=UPI00248566CB|nr:uncharacterized protein LOC129899620 [Solanum dulcamara]
MASTLTTPTPKNDVVDDQSHDTTFSTPVFQPAPPTTRRSPSSLSSSPSHSSNSSFGSSLSFHDILDDHNSPISPTTPLQFPKGIPFSWEKLPGIPKQIFSKKNSTTSLGQLLPLMPPPAGNANISNSSKKITSFLDEFSPRKSAAKSFRKDPFFAAFVECSKDDQQQYDDDIWKNGSSKVPSIRSLSDRFGFISMYTSCKRTCTVSESIVYLPRSRNYTRKY